MGLLAAWLSKGHLFATAQDHKEDIKNLKLEDRQKGRAAFSAEFDAHEILDLERKQYKDEPVEPVSIP